MPQLNVLSWNSGGETPAKATLLSNVINNLQTNHNWQPDVVFIQEANNGNQGDIYQYLNTSALFQHPVATVSEGGNQARAYIMAAAVGINVTQPFGTVSLIGDQGVLNWIQQFSPNLRATLTQEINSYRRLGRTQITVANGNNNDVVNLWTWHAPRGNSVVGAAPNSLPGGANPDAYMALEESNFYGQAIATYPVCGLVGDMNIQQAAIGSTMNYGGTNYEVLEDWSGFGSKLDFALGLFANGGAVANGFDFPDPNSPHNIIGATYSW